LLKFFLSKNSWNKHSSQGILQGEVSRTVDLLFDWFGLVCFANKNKNCQLSNSWFQTSQTGCQWYSDTSPFSIPCSSWFVCRSKESYQISVNRKLNKFLPNFWKKLPKSQKIYIRSFIWKTRNIYIKPLLKPYNIYNKLCVETACLFENLLSKK